jgi:hypothetical protein
MLHTRVHFHNEFARRIGLHRFRRGRGQESWAVGRDGEREPISRGRQGPRPSLNPEVRFRAAHATLGDADGLLAHCAQVVELTLGPMEQRRRAVVPDGLSGRTRCRPPGMAKSSAILRCCLPAAQQNHPFLQLGQEPLSGCFVDARPGADRGLQGSQGGWVGARWLTGRSVCAYCVPTV